MMTLCRGSRGSEVAGGGEAVVRAVRPGIGKKDKF